MDLLYKNKYIIAIYDKDDFLQDVFFTPMEMAKTMNLSLSYTYGLIDKIRKGTIKSNRIFLIDVYEKHNDIFKEEDKAFIEFLNNIQFEEYQLSADYIVKTKGVSKRTAFRILKLKKQQNETKEKENFNVKR